MYVRKGEGQKNEVKRMNTGKRESERVGHIQERERERERESMVNAGERK